MAFQQQNRNDVPVATAMMQLGQAGTGAKTGLAFEHDQASIAREENSLDYVSIFGKLKYEIGYATSTKYETFVTKFGVPASTWDCDIVYVSINSEIPMHSFVERGVPLFVTHGKNVKSNGGYLELRGLKDASNFVTAVTNASAKQSIEAKRGRRHPMPSAPLESRAYQRNNHHNGGYACNKPNGGRRRMFTGTDSC